jgi:outer membrane biogenesis lipoprotein LolB
MRLLVAVAVAALLSGCGLDAASSAATAASLKKQELEQGQKTMQQAQQKINGAMQQMQERAANADR